MKYVLLAVHCKKSKPVDVKDATRNYVAQHYGPKAENDVEDDLEEVQRLRDKVIAESHTLWDQRQLLEKYHRILTAMESRFPISRSLGHVTVLFPWVDAFKDKKIDSQANIHFEKAAVVFNLGAIASQLALSVDRKTATGAKDCSKFFQEAAGCFAHMRDHSCLKIDNPRPTDMTFECATMLEKLMLAQAQEVVLEKAAADHKSAATQARLAKQIAAYYDECSKLLTVKPLSEHFDRSWQAHATVKSLLYHLEADLQNAFSLRDEDELKGVANEISRLRAAAGILASAKKEAKNASKELQESVQEKEDSIKQRLAKSERENATVYLQRIPDAADLPAIVPAAVVKPIPPANIEADEATQKMFHGIVPETSAKSISKYTDMVDTLTRKQTEKLDAASDDARIKLREWELPESLQALEPGSVASLPDALRIELEGIESQGGMDHLNDLLSQVKQLRAVANEELDVAAAELEAEQREDDELRRHYGARWKRPASLELSKTMRDKVEGYRGNLVAAGESDAKLHNRIVTEFTSFALSPEAAAMKMPRLEAPMLSVDNMEPATIVSTLRHALEGLNTLSTQRASLEEALKERKRADDILPKLLTVPGDNVENFFKHELTKYDDLVRGVDENLMKQQQLLQVIAQNERAFRQAYNFSNWKKACEDAASVMRVEAKSYKEVADNLTEGMRFYMSLQEAVAALRQQIGDFCVTRKLQRDDMLTELKKAADAQEAAAQQQLASLKLQQQQQQYPPQYNQPPPPAQANPQYPNPNQYPAVAVNNGPPPPPPQDYVLSAPPPPYQQQGNWMQGQQQQQQQQQQPGGGYPGLHGALPPSSQYYQNAPPPPPQQYQQQQQPQQNQGWFGFGRQ